jgi:GDP-4-dehydro-6-deoxy-D-mannose reductase
MQVCQLGSGRAVSVEQIVQTLVGLNSRPIQVVVDQSPIRCAEAPTLWGETSKAENAVGWTRQYALAATLRDLKSYWVLQFRFGAVATPEAPAGTSQLVLGSK